MQRFNVVTSEARVVECISQFLFRAELSNGHQVLVRIEEDTAVEAKIAQIESLSGAKVLVELRAFDPSRGTILDMIAY